MISLEINIDGDIDRERLNQAMIILGELVINKVKDNIRAMDLIQSGDLLQHWFSKWDGTTLTIDNTHEYAKWIEFGTYGYWTQYGMDNYTDPVHPKKKDMAAKLRKQFPKGMQPFAPVRRVLFNSNIMNDLIKEAFANV